MTIKLFYKGFAALLMSVAMMGANANSVSFDSVSYDGNGGTFSATINYDFTDFAMAGGGINLTFDPSVLSLVSYTRADHTFDQAYDPLSPIGALESPGVYVNFGIGAFDFIVGMQDAGQVGTFVFDVISTLTGDTVLNLSPHIPQNPFISLVGQDVTSDIFAGVINAPVLINQVPIPAAAWLFGSALLGLGIVKRKKA